MTKTAAYRFRQINRACENFGAVDYTVTDTITERDGGVQVDTHALGVAEGERVDQHSSRFFPGVAFEAACSYRERNGYARVPAKAPAKSRRDDRR